MFHDVRPAFSITTSGPGSDLAGETAAALASSAIWFRMLGESDYADECLGHARTLFKFADEYRGKYTDTIPAGGFYESWSGFNDEIVWAAAWIAKVNILHDEDDSDDDNDRPPETRRILTRPRLSGLSLGAVTPTPARSPGTTSGPSPSSSCTTSLARCVMSMRKVI